MAYSPIGSGVAAGSGDTNSVTSGAYNTTGADTIFLVVGDYEAVTKTTISDSKGNTWHERTEQVSGLGSSGRVRIFYAYSATVGAGHTFTASGTGAYPSITVLAFSGGLLTDPYDQENGFQMQGVSTPQPGSITPGQANEIVIVGMGWSGSTSGTPTLNGGFSSPALGQNFLTSTYFGVGLSYLIQTTATAANPTVTFDTNVSGGLAIASFKVAGGGGGGGTASRNLLMLGVG